MYFGELADVFQRTAFARLSYGPGEEALAEAVVIASHETAAVSPDDLAELGSLAKAASLMISGDTGPIHIAGAVGTPLVGIYGPTNAERNGPWASQDLTVTRFKLRMSLPAALPCEIVVACSRVAARRLEVIDQRLARRRMTDRQRRSRAPRAARLCVRHPRVAIGATDFWIANDRGRRRAYRRSVPCLGRGTSRERARGDEVWTIPADATSFIYGVSDYRRRRRDGVSSRKRGCHHFSLHGNDDCRRHST